MGRTYSAFKASDGSIRNPRRAGPYAASNPPHAHHQRRREQEDGPAAAQGPATFFEIDQEGERHADRAAGATR